MDLAVRRARADDVGADHDVVTFLAVVDSSTECMRAIASETTGATDDFASSVADFVKNLFAGRFRLRCDNEPLDHGGGGESEGENALPAQRTRTIGEQLRTLRCDTQNRHMRQEILTRSGWHHTAQGSV